MKLLLYSCFLATFALVSAFEDWSFIVLADWHGAEGFATLGNRSTEYNVSIQVLSHIKDNYGGDLVFMPGDTNRYVLFFSFLFF